MEISIGHTLLNYNVIKSIHSKTSLEEEDANESLQFVACFDI